MIRVPTHRSPTHPGDMLLAEFLTPIGISQEDVANAIHVQSRQPNEHQSVTPTTALRLAKFFGMSADFWMNLQLRSDWYHTQKDEAETLDTIRPHALRLDVI